MHIHIYKFYRWNESMEAAIFDCRCGKEKVVLNIKEKRVRELEPGGVKPFLFAGMGLIFGTMMSVIIAQEVNGYNLVLVIIAIGLIIYQLYRSEII